MNISILDWMGYIASLIVLISLVMNSIIKLRFVNLVGAFLFSIYGFLIGSLPVGVLNAGIVIVNLYHLYKIYKTKEYFHLLSVEPSSHYFSHFIEFYKEDIAKFSKIVDFNTEKKTMAFYILRNLVTAGMFIANEVDKDTLKIELDYAIQEYRDFKVGKFIHETHKDLFIDQGYKKLIVEPINKKQEKYVVKMGFEKTTENGKLMFVKIL